MADREVRIGLASYVRADSPEGTTLWGFGLLGETVEVRESDVERFDRLNGAVPAPVVPLPEVPAVNKPVGDEPPRSGRGSGLDSWTAYAESLDLVVDEGMSRDDVVALVDDLNDKS